MPKDEVRKIAEGRIYTGRQAKEIGLIDRLGGLKDAIAAARDFANIPASAEIKIVHYPGPASIGEALEGILGASSGDIGTMVARVQNPVPTMTFDTQLQLLTQRIQPLCWMAAPEFSLLLAPPQVDAVPRLRRELLGLPAARP
jgi:ClpP class serine protease